MGYKVQVKMVCVDCNTVYYQAEGTVLNCSRCLVLGTKPQLYPTVQMDIKTRKLVLTYGGN